MTETALRKPPTRRRKGWTDQQSLFWFRVGVLLVALLLRFWVRRFRSVGAEQVPGSGGVFVVANHTSGMDPFLVGFPIWKRTPRGPGKVELFANPVFGFLMRKLGIFPLRTGVADTAAVRTMIELYRKGNAVIVFPEGGRSPSGELRPFVPEFARLAIRLKGKMIPCAVAGAGDLLPIGKRIPKRDTAVVVVYGEPFELSEFYDRPLTPALAEEAAVSLRRRVAELLEIARRERTALSQAG